MGYIMAKVCDCKACSDARKWRENKAIEQVRTRVLNAAKARGLKRPHDSYAMRKLSDAEHARLDAQAYDLRRMR